MAYRERQKISQMTPKGADLSATDLVEISVLESGSYVTKSVTGLEIINAASGGALDLQIVTDNGNTTTNDLIVSVENPNDKTTVSDQYVKTENGTTGTYTSITAIGGLQLKVGDEESQLKNTNVTNVDVVLEFPNKPTGSYTIATTEDVATPTLQEVTDAGNTTTTQIIVSDSTESTYVTTGGVNTENTSENTYATLSNGGELRLKAGAEVSTLMNSNVTNTGVTLQFPNKTTGEYTIATTSDLTSGTVTSVDLTMPSAFTVTGNPITTSGTLAVTGAGVVSQYVRGDGSLANFPSVSGGGASTSYYLNGSVSQGTIGGVTYYEMNKTPILGAGTDFIRTNGAGNGYIASFLTDSNDPNLLKIPGGNWNLEFYFSASSSGSTPSFYVELYKYNGTTFTLIASNSANPEIITGGTSIDAYFTSLSVPETILVETDRLAIRVYVTPAGRTITLHTEDNHLCQVITTFTTGLTALNGLTDQVQIFATGTSGTDFGISSTGSTHTFNLPTASATNRGALSSADWTTFNDKASYTPRVQSVTSAATVTPVNTNDLVKITAQAAGLTLANPTGTWDEGQSLIIRIKDNGTARSIAYGTNFRSIGVTAPTTTVANKTTYIGCIYNSTDTKFDIIGVCTEA